MLVNRKFRADEIRTVYFDEALDGKVLSIRLGETAIDVFVGNDEANIVNQYCMFVTRALESFLYSSLAIENKGFKNGKA